LTQLLDSCIKLPPAVDAFTQKAVRCCEKIICWDFGIEEGTFRRVSFGPVTAPKLTTDYDDEEDKQPVWPGSWGNVVNEFVVDLLFKVFFEKF